jgi:hypothetical protein
MPLNTTLITLRCGTLSKIWLSRSSLKLDCCLDMINIDFLKAALSAAGHKAEHKAEHRQHIESDINLNPIRIACTCRLLSAQLF